MFLNSTEIENVEQEIIKEKRIEKQLEIIANNTDVFLNSNLMEAEVFLLDIMRLIPDDESISHDLKYNFYYLLANIYKEKKEYELALEFNFKAFLHAERSDKPKNLANCYLLFGDLYYLLEDYEQAVEYDLLGVKFCEDRKEEVLKTKFYLMLGKVYYAIENYDDAEKYLLDALNMTLGKQDFDLVAEIKLFLGKVYIGIKDIEKAESNLLSNEVILNKVSNKDLLAKTYKELMVVYSYKNDTDKALEYAMNSLSLAKQQKNEKLKNDVELNVAKIYIQLELYDKAEMYLDDIMDFIEMNGNSNHKLDYYFTYMNLYELKGDFKSAYKYQKKYLAIKDEMLNDSKAAAINDALKKYESEKNERELELTKNKAELDKQKGILLFIIVIFVAVIIAFAAVLLFYRSKRQQKQNDLLQQKNKEIEDQKEELELLNNELVNRNVEIEEINLNLIEQEAELRESNATKDKFLSIIAHDLKNPIAGIMMTTELLVEYIDKFDKDKLVDKINEINRASVRLKDLLETLLEWARATTGQIPFNPEPINIDESVDNINQLLDSNLKNKNISLIIENPACCRIIADNKMLETIIRNIISNAIKFTPEGGKIIVSSEDIDDKLRVNIKDTGVGIPEDKIPQLFNISSNYSTLGTQKEKGTGLGLVLCKEFIDLNKGTIEVKSELGKGTTFSITLNKYISE